MAVRDPDLRVGEALMCVSPIKPLEIGVIYRFAGFAPFIHQQYAMVVVELDGKKVHGGPFWRWRFDPRRSN